MTVAGLTYTYYIKPLLPTWAIKSYSGTLFVFQLIFLFNKILNITSLFYNLFMNITWKIEVNISKAGDLNKLYPYEQIIQPRNVVYKISLI